MFAANSQQPGMEMEMPLALNRFIRILHINIDKMTKGNKRKQNNIILLFSCAKETAIEGEREEINKYTKQKILYY